MLKFKARNNLRLKQYGGEITQEQHETMIKLIDVNSVEQHDEKITYMLKERILDLIFSHPLYIRKGTLEILKNSLITYSTDPIIFNTIRSKIIWTALKLSRFKNTENIPDEWIDISLEVFANMMLQLPDFILHILFILRYYTYYNLGDELQTINLKRHLLRIKRFIDCNATDEEIRNMKRRGENIIINNDVIVIDNPSTNRQNVLIYFEYRFSEFNSLSKIRNFDGKIIIFNEDENVNDSLWYIGKDNFINMFLDVEIKPHNKPLFMGISKGGYGAIKYSNNFDKALCLSFNPQTFFYYPIYNYDAKYVVKNDMATPLIPWWHKHKNKYDLNEHIKPIKMQSPKYIIIGRGECDSQPIWQDMLMAGHMYNNANIKILITEFNMHYIFRYVDINKINEIMSSHYDIFINNHNGGLDILKNKIFYDPQLEMCFNNICEINRDDGDINYLMLEKIKDNDAICMRHYNNKWLVIFSQHDNFNLYYMLKGFNGCVLYFKNITKYTDDLYNLINDDIYVKNASDVIFVGENICGNVAYAMSCHFNSSLCFAFNPLTFDDSEFTNENNILPYKKNDIVNLVEHTNIIPNNAFKYCIFNKTTCSDIDNLSRLNLLHAGHLTTVKNTQYQNIIHLSFNGTNIFDKLDFEMFIKLLNEKSMQDIIAMQYKITNFILLNETVVGYRGSGKSKTEIIEELYNVITDKNRKIKQIILNNQQLMRENERLTIENNILSRGK